MLSCHSLTLQVPGRILCRDLSVTFAPGEVWAVLGRNGSGKSTLMHALAGLDHATTAAVTLDGLPLMAAPRAARARAVGVLLQHEETQFWGGVLDFVLLGCFPHARAWRGFDHDDAARAMRALDAVGLGSESGRSYVTLSGGERQRARIAQLLAQDPRVFLLDEPLQHLDLQHQVRVLGLFQQLAGQQERAVAIVLHDALWPSRFCSHALLLYDDGTALTGPARDVLTRAHLERLFDSPLTEVGVGEDRYFVPHV
jgi:iron complex transport system ATP-binding protein